MEVDDGREVVSELERLARSLRASEQVEGLYPAQWSALRYLARANRFSRSPGALAAFLGATKGTVSQSLIALERKGLIVRKPDPRDRRVRRLSLSEAGRRLLARDPLHDLAALAAGLPKKRRRGLARGLSDLLAAQRAREGGRAFGSCHECRHFQALGADRPPAGPHRCARFQQPLSDAESRQICVEQAPRAGG